jgi:endonuclease-3
MKDKNKSKLKILHLLEKEYSEAETSLRFKNVFELLVSTILSAQCTDKRVNLVTEKLFRKYKKIEDYAHVKLNVLMQDIRSTGFYMNKAKNIINSAKKILKDFDGEVPDTMENLLKLPGVARKTANIVLCSGFGKTEGIAVDTHVKRLSQRLGFSENKDPNKIEKDLMNLFNKDEWKRLSYVLIEHGRKICTARNPKCKDCIVNKLCPSKKFFVK